MAGSLDRYRFQAQLGRQLEKIDDPTKLFKTALSQIVRHLPADAGGVVLLHPVSGELLTLGSGRGGADWDARTVRAFIALERPGLPENEIMAPILIGGRPIGVMALRRQSAPFDPGDGRWLGRLCRKLAHEAELREERRINRVVDQIKDKTVRELRPKDLFYQILHGLRSLTRYDHSSALLIAEEDGARLVLHAEQIAWVKAKSRRIGRRLKLPETVRPMLRRAGSVMLVSPAATPHPGRSDGDGGIAGERLRLARLLRWGGKGSEPAEGSILIAPLHYENQLIGVLKIAARRAGAFGTIESDAVARVVPYIVSVIHNARRALSMEERIIAAEKKHAMADLARAISHDVKNAIGAILPTAQQAREEVKQGKFNPQVLAEDLRQIEQSARICQRIFDGMLQLARSEARPVERAPLTVIFDGALSVLGSRMKRLGVELDLKIPADLPEIRASRGGLEQLFLNLIANALEAMSAGGRLTIRARASKGQVEVQVSDTGTGIPQDKIERIQEPFYTTKDEGFGLGLSICRSILWENQGKMELKNRRGGGTTVTVTLPAAPDGKLSRAGEGVASPAAATAMERKR
jgi:signal transduction histidine kinase